MYSAVPVNADKSHYESVTRCIKITLINKQWMLKSTKEWTVSSRGEHDAGHRDAETTGGVFCLLSADLMSQGTHYSAGSLNTREWLFWQHSTRALHFAQESVLSMAN